VLLFSTNLPLSYRLSAVTLYVAVSEIWIAMIFLSAARDYFSIALSFAVGYLVSFVAAIGLGADFGAHAYLMGFAAGQVLTLGLLTARVLTEFETTEFFNFEFVGYFRRYPALIGIGFFYGLALWVDKIAFWLSPQGMDVGTYLKIFPPYDTIFFVASLVSFVPALVMFTVHLETDFYEYYKRFYATIQDRGGLVKLLEAKEGMARSIRTSYLALLKVQSGLVLLVVTLLAPIMHVWAGVPAVHYSDSAVPGYAGQRTNRHLGVPGDEPGILCASDLARPPILWLRLPGLLDYQHGYRIHSARRALQEARVPHFHAPASIGRAVDSGLCTSGYGF
jgi:polysaccharide biosynthesis protein PelG